ncbi:MAG: hypothetical protein ACXABY_29770 [Candidatus Thorarchaeota archaeon]
MKSGRTALTQQALVNPSTARNNGVVMKQAVVNQENNVTVSGKNNIAVIYGKNSAELPELEELMFVILEALPKGNKLQCLKYLAVKTLWERFGSRNRTAEYLNVQAQNLSVIARKYRQIPFFEDLQ